MIITSDDSGTIKTWDIRSFHCLQTIDRGNRTIINKLLVMENLGKIAFIGCRVNFLDFDSYDEENKTTGDEVAYAIKAEYNILGDELIICTRSDVRFINMETG
jgi:hypothetical protein